MNQPELLKKVELLLIIFIPQIQMILPYAEFQLHA